jgi:hypothetical protein
MKLLPSCLLLALAWPARALAAPPPARFAIILGVNDSVDKDAAALRYADDDAAAYLQLFRTLGARTYLLTRFDDSTRRLQSQAVAEAQEPRRDDLRKVVAAAAADVASARARHVPTVLYFVYAGHGRVDRGRGYLALEDARLYGADIERMIVDRVGADQTHIVVDACYSVFLAFSRGPGGARRDLSGFSSLGGLASRPTVGLLLSTSSARESHEWSEFQAGVFSHEVRSGLLGAADANRDGQVTYREIAAFVERANAAIPNDKFRPDVYAKEPAAGPTLVDLRPALDRRLELDGEHPGHYMVEDARGVRVADFHNAPGQPLHLIRVVSGGPLFLRRLDPGQDDQLADEYVIDSEAPVLRLADLRSQPSTSSAQARGAAHESFRLLFALPFSQQVVDGFVLRRATSVDDTAAAGAEARAAPARSLRRPVAFGLLAGGVVAAGGATWAVLSALDAHDHTPTSQADLYQNNRLIESRNQLAAVLFGVSAAAVSAGTILLLWPRLTGPSSASAPAVAFAPQPNGGAMLEWLGRF